MKSGKIVVYKSFENISPFVAFVQEKEIFISGDFIEKKYALIALKKKSTDRKEIAEEKIKSTIIMEDTVHSFAELYTSQLEKIHKESNELGYELSWLQVMQILFIQMHTEETLPHILVQLNHFYEKHIIPDETVENLLS